MEYVDLAPFVLLWLLCAYAGSWIGHRKGKSWAGFWLGFLFGPLGVLITAVLEPSDAVRGQRNIDIARAMAAVAEENAEYEVPADTAPGWKPDPTGRNRFRHWNGTSWTARVITVGGAEMIEAPPTSQL